MLRAHLRRPLSFGLALSLAVGLVTIAHSGVQVAKANIEAGTQVSSTWSWTGNSNVSQRYGCTDFSGEDQAPTGWCPSTLRWWHHGIDINDDTNQPNPNVGCTAPYDRLPSGPGSPLYADGSGTVIQAGTTTYGTIVEWQRDSDAYYIVLYHTQSIQVSAGGRVWAGKLIAYVGNAGYPTYSTACHLHFEVRKPPGGYWDDVDPSAFLGTSPYLGRSAVDQWPQQNFNGTLNVFARAADTSMRGDSQSAPSSANWQGWASLGGGLGSGAAAVLNSNVVGIFARGPATPDVLWYDEQLPNSASWTGWTPLGGLIQGTPAAASIRDGDPAVFALGQGSNPSMWWQYRIPGGGWSGWMGLGGGLISDPAVTMTQNGTLEVFAEGPTGNFWYDQETVPDGTTWTGWNLVSTGILAGKPAVGRNTDGTLQVFGLGPAGGVIWTSREASPDSNNWATWNQVPNGSLASDPMVASTADGSLDVFALGPTLAIWSDKQSSPGSGSWTGWVNLGDIGRNVPSGRLNSDGTLSVFVSVIYSDCYGIDAAKETVANGTAWSGWQSLGCP